MSLISRIQASFLKFLYLYLVFIFAIGANCFASNQNTIKNAPHKIKLYNAGWTPEIRRYQNEILRALFDATIAEFGSYQIEYHQEILSGNRLILELIKGSKVHASISTGVNNESREVAFITQLSMPLFNHVLGLRKLIIKKGNHKNFSSISSAVEFKSKTAGLVIGWRDAEILSEAGITVKDAVRYTNLFPMLVSERFDYIPLGLIEVGAAIKEKPEFQESVEIYEDLYIFYPIPVFINVSNLHVDLKKRIQLGIKKLEAQNTIQKTFLRFFSKEANSINADTAKVFIFHNSGMSLQENKQDIEKALSTYFSPKTKIFYNN